MKPNDALSMHNEFSMLGLPDLLLAREKNHVELMRKAHVIGTAVGLYLIRSSDPWPKKGVHPHGKRSPRTLANSEVRDYSWPCILVFVDEWKDESELGWRDMVPESLYLDAHRKVPVCVVWAPRQDAVETPVRNVLYPSSRIGGGFPVFAEVQGREHIASIGCLVRDGHTVYALTNRHVTGEENEQVYGRFGGQMMRIGVSSKKQLTRRQFNSVYSEWAGKDVYLNMDIGLIRIDSLDRWTAQVYGIGTMGPMADLGVDNLTLRLIGCPVVGYGCGSGRMSGAIKALFYRYKSVGGFEYVSDFLIGARKGQRLGTHPGDSGTVWLLESPDQGPMPIAVQWGGQVFTDGSSSQTTDCALATCLSTVCNILGVDVIRDWNIGATEYWGEVGHFTIGALACTLAFTGQPGVAKLMSRNIDNIGFDVATLRQSDKVRKGTAHFSFVPLADVADDVWRFTRPADSNNHFADMDQKALSGRFKGKTLLDLAADPQTIDPAIWNEFYQGTPGTNPGALPFRVWQGYNEMVASLQKADVARFLCAAGCTAHYVGDACQPLHISRLHHNDPSHQTSVGKKVHSVYETDMLNAHAADIVDGAVAFLKGKAVSATFSGGHGAAERVVQLMSQTVQALPPQDIIDAYNEETSPSTRLARLFTDFGEKTIDLIGEGCVCMAEIWASAWKEGGGESLPASLLVAIDTGTLTGFVNDKDFLPSMSLEKMIPLLNVPAAAGPAPAPAKKAAVKKKTAKKAPAKKAPAKKKAAKKVPVKA